MWDMTRSYVGHSLFIFVTTELASAFGAELIRMWDMTGSYVGHG